MKIDDLTIGEAKQIAAQFAPAKCRPPAKSSEFQIVVLDRGFVYVGDVTIDGDWCVITNAKNIRRWGTTKGLGELAASGPQANTNLDPAGTVRAPLRALIVLIDCEPAKWAR